MALDITATAPTSAPTHHVLPATPESVYWGYIDRDEAPRLTVRSGDTIQVEAITHHAGDAPDLLMDEGIHAIWNSIAEADRGPGVHILTGPIAVEGAEPGDSLVVKILEMQPRMPYGSNCAANWGLLYNTFGKERITIYGLDVQEAGGVAGEFTTTATPSSRSTHRSRSDDLPGVISESDPAARQPFSRAVKVPVRPHFGVMGVAPAESGKLSSIPPSVYGGNVDNWRVGPGRHHVLPVFAPGGNLYVGDPHFAQGDGEICGTAIEASLTATIQVWVVKAGGDTPIRNTSPLLETPSHWYTHGFGADLGSAMTMAAEQMLWLMQTHLGLSADDAYSLSSVAMDLGITQVVDGTLGCHAGVARAIFS